MILVSDIIFPHIRNLICLNFVWVYQQIGTFEIQSTSLKKFVCLITDRYESLQQLTSEYNKSAIVSMNYSWNICWKKHVNFFLFIDINSWIWHYVMSNQIFFFQNTIIYELQNHFPELLLSQLWLNYIIGYILWVYLSYLSFKNSNANIHW